MAKRFTHQTATEWMCTACNVVKPISEFYRISTSLRIHAKCKPCYKLYKNAWLDKYPDKRERAVSKTKEWRRKLKEDTFAAYGGAICACCGETELAFLQLDHINGGGTKERKLLKADSAFFRYKLREQGFPPGFRILCANCNFGRALNGGICPHEEKRWVLEQIS